MEVSDFQRPTMHLKEKEITQKEERCPFCGSKNRKAKLTIQNTPEVHLLKCNDCHACSASKMPTQATLEKYYSSYYDSNEEGITFSRKEVFGKHLCMYSKSSLKGNISILDYGGGNGGLAYETAKKLIKTKMVENITITVVDYSEETISSETSEIMIGHCKYLSEIESDKEYDFVIASAIVEHIPEGGKILKSLLQRVKKEGVFYARTPYMSELQLVLRSFDFIPYPEHVHDLGRKFWNNITGTIDNENTYQIIRSAPSIVEDSFKINFFRTLAAYFFKSLWYIFRIDKYVGGWEIFLKKQS